MRIGHGIPLLVFAFLLSLSSCIIITDRDSEEDNPVLKKLEELKNIELPSFEEQEKSHEEYPGVVEDDNVDPHGRASRIVTGCNTQYDKALAIYRWECANIAYDTDFKVYSGEECWRTRKGVCQAYSELFCILAKECGLQAEIISGIGKNSLYPNGAAHAWVKAKTEKGWILIEPTWGAGYVNGNRFERKHNDMSWFDVDPYWMIFTHYPNDAKDQFLPHPLTKSQFDCLPDAEPVLGVYQLNAEASLNYYLSNVNVGIPLIFDCDEAKGKMFLDEIPLCSALKVGREYTFRIRITDKSYKPHLDGTAFGAMQNWKLENDVYSITVRPQKMGHVILSLEKRVALMTTYKGVLQYDIVK